MEPWRASMRPIMADSFAPNGSEAIAIFAPNRRTLNSSIIKTTATATSKVKPHCKRFRRRALFRFFPLLNSSFPTSITSRKERSLSSGLSAVIENWISSEKILRFLKNLFTPMSELKSLRSYIKSRSIRGTNWSQFFLTNYHPRFPQIFKRGKRCSDTCFFQFRVNDVLIFAR